MVSFVDKEPEKPAATLLVVDDEAMIRESTAEFLSRSGYKVLAAGSAEEALDKLQSYNAPIELVITDVVLPRMSGAELAEKCFLTHPEARILFTSGYTETVVLKKNVPGPPKHFLQKPFSLRSLLEKVAEVLNQSSRARAAGTAG